MTFAPKTPNHWPVILKCLATGLVLMAAMASALTAEVPPWVLRGIAQVETGSDWRDIGDLTYRDRRIGDAGEVGPWQLAPSVLRDLHAYRRRARIHADPVLAESLTRAWLLHLYGVTGSWPESIAAYHAGLSNRRKPYAIEYAERVGAVGNSTGLQTLPADAAR